MVEARDYSALGTITIDRQGPAFAVSARIHALGESDRVEIEALGEAA